MRKIFVFALSTLFIFILQFSFPKAYAVCYEGKDIKGVLITAKEIKNNPDREKDIDECLSIDTAIGQIPTEAQGFVKTIFSLVLGMAGGIALILIIIAGYKYMSSQGNPEAVKGATETLTSAVVGLLFIILSFVILQVIGVDILKIPGFK